VWSRSNRETGTTEVDPLTPERFAPTSKTTQVGLSLAALGQGRIALGVHRKVLLEFVCCRREGNIPGDLLVIGLEDGALDLPGIRILAEEGRPRCC
jgi:hypothetical protein